MASNALDRLIGIFDPTRALRRVVDRSRLQRAYEAASPRDSWKPRRGGASAQADHFADATKLRAKARSLVQNVPYIAASMDALVANVIGTGITPRFTGPAADKLNKLWKAWTQVCDADGRLDFYGMQAAGYRAMEQDGEVLYRLRPRRPADGLPAPLQLQLLEIDWLDSTRNSLMGGGIADLPPDNIIIEGIEYDQLGRVAAYWLWDQHPGDATLLRGFRNFSKRVPAESIVHLFDPKRPGQARGITRLAPIIVRTRDTQLYEDAELARKNLESRLSVLVSGDASLMANENQLAAPTANGAADVGTARRTGDLGELTSGGITELPAGNTITTIEPKAAGGHVEYVTHQLHIITAALGVTYEMATGDMAGTNFSSARVRMQDVRRGFEHTQWMILIPRGIKPLCDAFAAAAMLAGKVPDGVSYGIEYDTPKWDYVNPQQEAQSDALQVATGLSSLSSKLRARGENPDTVFAEIAADFKKLKDLEVLDILFFLQKGSLRIVDPATQPILTQGQDPLLGQQRADEGGQITRADSADGSVHTTGGNGEPMQITVHPPRYEIHVAAPVVNMPRQEPAVLNLTVPPQEPPVVHVSVPSPEVRVLNQPAAVTVNVPAQEFVTEVDRDPISNRIIRTTRRNK